MNLHTPERQSFETQAEYRDRRKQSQRAVKTMTKGPTQAPFIMIPGGPPPNWVHFWTGQHTNEGKLPSRRDLHRLASKTFVHKAKPLPVRKHKPHQHPKDATGVAVTMIGRPRRIWLGGISAQRGY